MPNQLFMKWFRQALQIPIGLPASEWLLELGALLMRTETEFLLKSRRVVPQKLLDHGFQFSFPEWSVAAKDLSEHTEG